MIVILIWSEKDPPVLLAQIVEVTAVVWRVSGVPEIAPVAVLRVRPDGKLGLISQEVALPPVVVGVVVVIV